MFLKVPKLKKKKEEERERERKIEKLQSQTGILSGQDGTTAQVFSNRVKTKSSSGYFYADTNDAVWKSCL